MPPFPPKKKIILIVDDDPISRKMIKSFLVEARFDVIEAGDAAECLKKLTTNPEIDLGLMDIEMPDINGIQLIYSNPSRRARRITS